MVWKLLRRKIKSPPNRNTQSDFRETAARRSLVVQPMSAIRTKRTCHSFEDECPLFGVPHIEEYRQQP